MDHKSAFGAISRLSAPTLGVFRGSSAVDLGVSRKQLTALRQSGAIERTLADTYRLTAVAVSREQHLRAALLWAGDDSGAAVRSAGDTVYGLEGVRASTAEIVVPRANRARTTNVIVHRSDERDALMLRVVKGLRVTGVEGTLVALGAVLDEQALEIACEDARRRRLTSMASLREYLRRFGQPGRAGIRSLRKLLDELDPRSPSRSTLEVKARRLLVANGLTDFIRELPLERRGRTYYFDFAFERERTILETNGRRWHDDVADYEHDNEKWTVAACHGYRVVFATWSKVTEHPALLLAELAETFAT